MCADGEARGWTLLLDEGKLFSSLISGLNPFE
jgi:hypothetical protein